MILGSLYIHIQSPIQPANGCLIIPVLGCECSNLQKTPFIQNI